MDVLTTILTCSLYLADDSLVRAIAESTSQRNPYFVLDTAIDRILVDPPAPPKSVAEALARTTDILANGGRPVLGLMQVPPLWMSVFGRELADAFDPCTNIAVGTAMLSQFDSECAAQGALKTTPKPRAPSAASRRCVLRKYEEAIGEGEFATVTTLELRYQRPLAPSIADAPIFAAPQARSWGPDQLLVPAAVLLANSTSPKNP
jgi:hypothetical protein